jgi:anti-sigma-K factor RskA
MAIPDHEVHGLAGAYALDAVTPAERSEFERHLPGCADCRDDVAGFREAAARLAAAAAVTPPSAVRAKVVGAATRIRQLPPRLSGPSARRRQVPRRAMAAGAAAAIAAAVTLATVAYTEIGEVTTVRPGSRMIAEILTAHDAEMLTAKISTGGTATVIMSRREHAAVVTAKGLAQPPAGYAYELWRMGPGGDQPAGLLTVLAGGMAGPAVVSGLRPGERLGLTVERAPGAARPTSGPLVLLG